MSERPPRPYADPYLAGVSLGLVLLAAFVIAGRGLGASGAFATAASSMTAAVDPEGAAANRFFSRYLTSNLFTDWLLIELIGVCIGAAVSAWVAGRMRLTVDRGTGVSSLGRLGFSAAGGLFMGIGAVLARGCTSGQALTGGAMLAVGAWLFIPAAFAAAYAVAPLMRWSWR